MHKFSKFAVSKLFLGLLITASFVMVPALAIGQTSAEQATQGVTISGKVKTA
jgi:hypothetical protein